MYDSLFKVVSEEPLQNERQSFILENKSSEFDLLEDTDSMYNQDAINTLTNSYENQSSLISLPDPLLTSITAGGSAKNIKLRSVQEIPESYRCVFEAFPYFNIIQSEIFDDVFYGDKSIVISAPTGSGKTVIFELAIIRFLMKLNHTSNFKMVYMAPMKAICSERYNDWKVKFGPLGLHCTELTGDSELDDYFELQQFSIILTTPEKWDGLTRRWQNIKSFVQLVRLFMVDEVSYFLF
ncbi:probable ATP-dependent DNA helicase HFM1 [Centruroides sculpturatus]|uniref:probable ATP-dependent DNA helicase HFM1 n=1 Tax=Centruroides sculpturatus TaxID=218467 RepID=UPI000C6D5E0E|nr:probable ATP-dependent DNA helicase HFM1 [Centruroides sculpturatus]